MLAIARSKRRKASVDSPWSNEPMRTRHPYVESEPNAQETTMSCERAKVRETPNGLKRA